MSTRGQSVEDLAATAAKAIINRATHVFTVPVTLQAEVGHSQVHVVELTAEEEIQATRRARGDQVRLAWELAKESLRQVDDKPLKSADGSIDSVWNRMHPKLRQMVMGAYGAVHSPKNDEAETFLGSHEIKVG